MIRLALLVVFLLAFAGAQSQDTLFVRAQKIAVGMTGSIYLIHGATITEIDRSGKTLYSYTLSPPDAIDYCDAVSPLEIILWNRSRNRLVTLDSKLSVISDRAPAFGNRDVTTVCSSSYGDILFFDSVDRQIVSDGTRSVKIQSPSFFSLPGYKGDLPETMISARDFILCDLPETGLLMFDMTLKYVTTLGDGEGVLSDARASDAILLKKGRVDVFSMETGNHAKQEIPETVKQVFRFKNEWILFDGEKIFFKNAILE